MINEPAPTLAGRRLVVTGATGFVGSAFVREAVASGADVTVISRAESDHWRLAEVAGQYRVLESRLDDLEQVAVVTADAVVHFAAAGVDQTFDDVDELVATNVVGTLRAVQFARRCGAGRFVLAGSSGEYGPGEQLNEGAPLRPTSEYGATRASATMIARSFGARRDLEVVVVRPFSVYGPYEAAYRLFPYSILRALNGQPIQISSGIQTRDFVHIADVARGVALATATPGVGGRIFNLCTGVDTSVRDAAEIVATSVGRGTSVEADVQAQIPGEMWRTSGDPTVAAEHLGWTSQLSVRDGVALTVEWFRDTGSALPFYADRG